MREVRAAVLRDPASPYILETFRFPEPGPGEVVVRIEAAGYCHTDVLPRSEAFPVTPLVTGHEGAGVVEAVGPGVRLDVGAHVVLTFDACHTCTACRTGHSAYCDEFTPRNLSGRSVPGSTPANDRIDSTVGNRWFGQSSFATHALVTERNAVEVDSDIPFDILAPLGCGVQTGAGSVLHALAVPAGASLAVYGAGSVGLAAIMAARIAGARTIVAVDRHEHRLALARELGATHTVVADNNTAAAVTHIVPGGTEFGLDTTGVPAVIAAGVAALRKRGIMGLVGVQSESLVLSPLALSSGKQLRGILEGDVVPHVFIPEMTRMWRTGQFPVERLVTRFFLDDINAAEAASLDGSVIKPVLIPEHHR
jgi:aryl-alcohol dehydrogenase